MTEGSHRSKLISSARSHLVRRLGAAHIAGSELADAVAACRTEADRGFTATLGRWSETSESSATVVSEYKRALDAIAANSLASYLSIKVHDFGGDQGLFRELLLVAEEHGIRVHFDSLGPEVAPQSLDLLDFGLGIYRNLSFTLPSRWERSLEDAVRLAGLGIPVRVVKGQWRDPGARRIDPRASFLDLVDVLAAERAPSVSVATHDRRLATEALTRLARSGTPRILEQMLGLPRIDARIPEGFGAPVCVYIPYGEAYLPYAIKQALRRPVTVTWVIRDLLSTRHRRRGNGP